MPMTALLFDAAGRTAPLPLNGDLPVPEERQLLWVDIEGADPDDLDRLLGQLPVTPETRDQLRPADRRPTLRRQPQQVLVRVNAAEKDLHHYRAVPVQILAGRNVVFTAHEAPVGFLQDFQRNVDLQNDAQLGELDSAAFLAVLLHRHLENFFTLLGPLEDNIDRLDERVLHEQGNRQHLETLAGLRRRVSELRRLLGAHRLVYAGLASPDFVIFVGDQPEALLRRLYTQFERAHEALAHTREMLVGSFDLYMSSTAQRTNEIMRVLTVVTVALGIMAALAGLMGMNFQADIFKAGNAGFRDTLLLGLGLILVVVGLSRWRGWL